MKHSKLRQVTRSSADTRHNVASRHAAAYSWSSTCQYAMCGQTRLISARGSSPRSALWQRFGLAVGSTSVPDDLPHALCLPGWRRWSRAQRTLSSLAFSRRQHHHRWETPMRAAGRLHFGKTVEKIEQLLSISGASLVYAGYPTEIYNYCT